MIRKAGGREEGKQSHPHGLLSSLSRNDKEFSGEKEEEGKKEFPLLLPHFICSISTPIFY